MIHIKTLANEIKNNKNLEANLPLFMNEMSSTYATYAGTNFVMHYYDLYEGMVDGHIKPDATANQLLEGINEIVKDNLLQAFDGEVREKSIKKLHLIRNEVMKHMKVLTAYTDIFTLYEYVMNRMELKFVDEYEEVDNDIVARNIVNFIFSENDNVIVNDRIKQMLSQMPIRMTKIKFFDLLKNALMVYEGAEMESLNNFVYMIRSAAGMDEPEGMEDDFAFLKECREHFSILKSGIADEAQYQELKYILLKAIDFLLSTTDTYYAMQQVINYLYALLLNQPYASAPSMENFEKIKDIVSSANEGFLSGMVESVPEHVVALFEETEGELEQVIMQVQSLEGILDEISNSHKSMVEAIMLEKQYECLYLSSKLISISVFIELENESHTKTKEHSKEKEDQIKAFASKKDIELVFESLYEELSGRLETQAKMLNRAMIAAVLRELPVFFTNHNEVLDYVKNSLASCRDLSEKLVSIRLMQELIEESK